MQYFDFLRRYENKLLMAQDGSTLLVVEVTVDHKLTSVSFFYPDIKVAGFLYASAFLSLVPQVRKEYNNYKLIRETFPDKILRCLGCNYI